MALGDQIEGFSFEFVKLQVVFIFVVGLYFLRLVGGVNLKF